MVTDRVKIQKPEDEELKKQLDKVDWSMFLQYGCVKIQVRQGKAVLVTKEETVKLD